MNIWLSMLHCLISRYEAASSIACDKLTKINTIFAINIGSNIVKSCHKYEFNIVAQLEICRLPNYVLTQ